MCGVARLSYLAPLSGHRAALSTMRSESSCREGEVQDQTQQSRLALLLLLTVEHKYNLDQRVQTASVKMKHRLKLELQTAAFGAPAVWGTRSGSRVQTGTACPSMLAGLSASQTSTTQYERSTNLGLLNGCHTPRCLL